MIRSLRKMYAEETEKVQKSKLAVQLFEKEKQLFEYCELMHENPCEEIVIREEGIHATFCINDRFVKMCLDEIDVAAVPHGILIKGFYEKEEFEIVMKLMSYLDEGAIIFDIGANLGWYGININLNNSSYQIHYFEPVLNTYQRLLKNLSLNHLEHIFANNIGLSNESKIVNFYYDVIASGASSMADLRNLETTQQIAVQMKKMDEYVVENNIQKLDFIKCDVEGSELLVYQGGIETIRKYKPIIFSEMLRKWSAKFGYHPNDIIDLFHELGYECFVIHDGYLKKFGRVDEETIETNYLFLHFEKHSDIIKDLVH